MILRLLACALALAVGTGCQSKCGPSSGLVLSAFDGDTIELEDGTTVRYILVDTPEVTKGDCYATQARDFNRQHVLGQQVELRYDEAQCEDRFGRTLAYVTNAESKVEVNSELVKQGYGCVLHIPPAGDSRAAEFESYELDARGAKAGVWGACNPVTCAN